MRNRTRLVLIGLFFAGLGAMWWAERAGLPTADERQRLEGLVLPNLSGMEPADIARIELVEGGSTIALERDGARRWRLVEPLRSLAEASRAEALVQGLIRLRRFEDAAAIAGDDPGRFGLAGSPRLIRLLGADRAEPLAVLELGNVVGDRRYVRRSGDTTIEAVPADAVEAADLPATEWRERSLLDAYAYDVAAIAVSGPDRDLLARYNRNRWRIERPIRSPGDAQTLNALLSDLADLQAVDGPDGFAADDASDLGRFGLDPPRLTIELTPAGLIDREDLEPRVAHVGAAVPGTVDRFYARREGEDDVMVIDAPGIGSLGLDATALRSKQVLQLGEEDFEAVRLTVAGVEHALVRSGRDWLVVAPTRGPADAATIGRLLNVLGSIETAEFLPPDAARDGALEDAPIKVEVWERGRVEGEVAASALPGRPPDAVLRIGAFVAGIRGRYGRLEPDRTTTLLLPATFDEVLPKGSLSYRDRTLAADDPRDITRIELRRARLPTTVLETSNQGLDWRMVEPVEAAADPLVVRGMAVVLAHLRAEAWVEDVGDGSSPAAVDAAEGPGVTWMVEKRNLPPVVHSLRLGGVAGQSGERVAWLDQAGDAFVLPGAAIAALVAEPMGRKLLGFDPRLVERLEIETGGERVSARRDGGEGPAGTTPTAAQWRIEPAVAWLDPEGCEALARALGTLTATRFLQYGGPIEPSLGLASPRMTIRATGARGPLAPDLRIGAALGGAEVVAALGDGRAGPVFSVPRAMIGSALVEPELPVDLFAR